MKRPACVVGCCLLVFLALFFYLKPPEPESMASISGKSIKIYGIVDDKYQKNKNTYLLVREAGIVSGKESNKKYKVTVKLKESLKNLSEAPKIGALVTVSGKVTEFSRARNPGNFDYAKYQIIRGIDFEIYGADAAEIPEKGRIRHMDEALCLLRERLSVTIDSIYKDEDAGEIKAILLGDRTDLTDELKSGYRRAGMSHILCISSLHVTLIGMGLLGLIRKTGLNKTASSIIAFSLISMYGRLTGSGISTVRALITFGLMIAAEFAGRTPDLLSSMAEAAVVIMLAKPLYVLDAGFILSFSAVCGIGMLGSPLKRLIPSDSGVIGSFRTSLSVTLFMLPETLYFFYQISVFSVLINLAVIPLLSILLTFSVISVIAGELFVPLGALFGIPVKLILALYRQITRLNDGIPLSVITPGRPEIWQIVLYYAILAGLIVYTERKYKPDTLIRVLCTAFIVLGVSMLLIRMRPDISLTMVDVGQGDCHLIETGDGKTVMIDCGSSDVDNAAKYRVIPYVLSRGHDSLDYAVVTHSDEDHISGYIEMLEHGKAGGMKLDALIMPDVLQKDENYMRLVNLAREEGIRVNIIKAGDSFAVGDVTFKCLNPKREAMYSNANASSVCLSVSAKDSSFRALYTGDVEDEGERMMIETLRSEPEKGRFTLLKCAHHGSKNSTPAELLDMIKPVYTFISAGIDNSYSHPHKELLKRLEDENTRIYVTKDKGAVRMDVDGNHIKVWNYVNQGGES